MEEVCSSVGREQGHFRFGVCKDDDDVVAISSGQAEQLTGNQVWGYIS